MQSVPTIEHWKIVLETTVPIALFYLGLWYRTRDQQKKQHEENKKQLAELATLTRFLPPHAHAETEGPLTVKGIRYEPGVQAR